MLVSLCTVLLAFLLLGRAAVTATVVGTQSSPGSHWLGWVAPWPSATGGDCISACAGQGQGWAAVGDGGAGNSTLCAKQEPSSSYLFDKLTGIKLPQGGCRYLDHKNMTVQLVFASSNFSVPPYLCACAQNGTTQWATFAGLAAGRAPFCPAGYLPSYTACRVAVQKQAVLGYFNIANRAQYRCFYPPLGLPPGSRVPISRAAERFDVLCDKIASPLITAGRGGGVTWRQVSKDNCAATCRVDGKVSVGSGTVGIRLCARLVAGRAQIGTQSLGKLKGSARPGCFLDETQPLTARSTCPLRSDYLCACQSNIETSKPVWVPRSLVSRCKQVVRVLGGVSICRGTLNGQFVFGHISPTDGKCRSIRNDTKKGSVCRGVEHNLPFTAMHVHDVLCERT